MGFSGERLALGIVTLGMSELSGMGDDIQRRVDDYDFRRTDAGQEKIISLLERENETLKNSLYDIEERYEKLYRFAEKLVTEIERIKNDE